MASFFCYEAVKRTPCLHGRTFDGEGNRAQCARCGYEAVKRTPCKMYVKKVSNYSLRFPAIMMKIHKLNEEFS